MKMYSVRAIKIGLGLQGRNSVIKKINVPAESEAEAKKKGEQRLGSNWGVVSAEVVP